MAAQGRAYEAADDVENAEPRHNQRRPSCSSLSSPARLGPGLGWGLGWGLDWGLGWAFGWALGLALGWAWALGGACEPSSCVGKRHNMREKTGRCRHV